MVREAPPQLEESFMYFILTVPWKKFDDDV
jgi:hypothetical protein